MPEVSLEEELDAAGIRGADREILLARMPPDPEPYAQMSERLGRTESALAQACSRARQRLRAYREGGEVAVKTMRKSRAKIRSVTDAEAEATAVAAPSAPLAQLAEMALALGATSKAEWALLQDYNQHPASGRQERAARLGVTSEALAATRDTLTLKLEAFRNRRRDEEESADIRAMFHEQRHVPRGKRAGRGVCRAA